MVRKRFIFILHTIIPGGTFDPS